MEKQILYNFNHKYSSHNHEDLTTMSDFSLIQQLDSQESPQPEPQSSVVYQQYELVIEGNKQKINIPKREAENFECCVAGLTERINRDTLRALLRTFRGTRSQ